MNIEEQNNIKNKLLKDLIRKKPEEKDKKIEDKAEDLKKKIISDEEIKLNKTDIDEKKEENVVLKKKLKDINKFYNEGDLKKQKTNKNSGNPINILDKISMGKMETNNPSNAFKSIFIQGNINPNALPKDIDQIFLNVRHGIR